MDWMVSESSLDQVQLEVIDEIVSDIGSNHWVKGFAGSGKTIVLTHVINRLAASRSRTSVAFVTYTHALKDMVETGLDGAASSRVTVSTLTSLKRQHGTFDVIVADEMQDANQTDLDGMIRKGKSYVIAADFDQSIYPASAGERALISSMRPFREHQLHEIHRINENVFRVATAVYPDVHVTEESTIRDDDSRTKLYKGSSSRDEFVTMFEEAVRVASRGNPSVILFPTWKLMDKFLRTIADDMDYPTPHLSVVGDKDAYVPGEEKDPFRTLNSWLRRAKSPLQVFGGGAGDLEEADGKKMVYLMTYHSVKGLEFSNVFMPHLNDETSLFAWKGGDEDDERRIFFVAATRAKETLYLSYHGTAHRFFEDIDDEDLDRFAKPRRTF